MVPVSTLHPFMITNTADHDKPASYQPSFGLLSYPDTDSNTYIKGTASASTALGIDSLHADPTSLPSSLPLSVPSSPTTPRCFRTVAKRLRPFSVSKFEIELLPLSSPKLHEGQSGSYSQQAPFDQAGSAEGSSGADTRKFYFETFKSSEPPPLIQGREQGFKEKVGTHKTALASLMRRKEAGKWTCSIEGCNSTFTRKQNLTC